jgi:hypothetical protein
MVAFIEALDHFSHRFSEHVRSRLTTFPTAVARNQAGRYVLDELRGRNPIEPRVGRLTIDSVRLDSKGRGQARRRLDARRVHRRMRHLREPVLRSGAALGWALNDVVEAILASKTLNFGQFRTWCNAHRPRIATVLDDVVGTWGLLKTPQPSAGERSEGVRHRTRPTTARGRRAVA